MKRHHKPPPFPAAVKETVYQAQNGVCSLFPRHACTGTEFLSAHHRIANTVSNRRRFPHLIDTCLNAVFLCQNCHTNHKHLLAIPEPMAEMYETWLQELRADADELAALIDKYLKAGGRLGNGQGKECVDIGLEIILKVNQAKG